MKELLKKLPEHFHVDGRTMKADEAIELWLKADVPPEEIKKRLMVGPNRHLALGQFSHAAYLLVNTPTVLPG